MMKLLLLLVVLGLGAMTYRMVSGVNTRLMLSRRFGPVLCGILGHKRRGDAVRKIDDNYYSRCRRCDIKLQKAGRDAEWTVAGAEVDDEHGHDIPPERDTPTSLIMLIVALIAAGALSMGLIMAPRGMQMREAPHQSYAQLAHQ